MRSRFYVTVLMMGLALDACSNGNRTYNGGTSEEQRSLSVINLSQNVQELKQLNLSDAVERMDIVKLETTDKSLLSNIEKLQVTENDIWIYHIRDQRIYRFSRNGKFLNTVGKIGQGPEEYVRIFDFFIDNAKKEVYIVSTIQGIKVYDYEGKFLRRVTNRIADNIFPGDKGKVILHDNQFLLSQNLAILRPISNPKDSLWSIAIADNNLNKIKLFKNPVYIGIEEKLVNGRAKPEQEGMFNYITEQNPTSIDSYNNELTFKLPGTDTIYIYNSAKKAIEPRFAITTNERKGDYAEINRWVKDRSDFNYFTIASHFRTKNLVYLVANKGEEIYTYCYDMRDNSVKRAKRQGKIIERKQPYMNAFGKPQLRLSKDFILANDINGGDFTVKFRSDGKYWINPLVPGSSDYEKFVADLRKAPDAPKKQELLNVLDNTDEEDNPILLIAVLK